jgi:hypothetical protein
MLHNVLTANHPAAGGKSCLADVIFDTSANVLSQNE